MDSEPVRGDVRRTDGDVIGVGRALAMSSVVWRGGVALVALLVFVVLPTGDSRHLSVIVGAAMIGVAVSEHLPRLFGGLGPPVLRGLAPAAAGTLILVWPEATESLIGLVLALVVLVSGALRIRSALREESARHEKIDKLLRGALLVVVAVVIAVFPNAITRLALVAIGVALIVEALLVVAAVGRIGPASSQTLSIGATHDDLLAWLAERRAPAEDRARIDQTLFFEGEERRRRVFRFYTLMALATAIATFGIASDSTAVVIGAMLIAPLMMPILGTAAALLARKPRRMARAMVLVTTGAAGAIGFAWFLALFLPNLVSVVANSQVTSRTSPNLIDLAIAMAAGGAGAFAVSRSDVSDSLPGVAVAIALVPPLAVVGITLRAGDVSQSLGALLLFLTNLVSIVITASIVFVITGYASIRRLQRDTQSVRTTYTGIAIGLLLLLIPLGVTGRSIFEDARAERTVERVLEDWLDESEDFKVAALAVDGDLVSITVLGAGDPPSPRSLHDAIQVALGTSVELELRVIPERVYRVGE
jgi:uncharacterized hydrophobic protein (TIGR00271 family)